MTSHKVRAVTHSFKTEQRKERKRVRRAGLTRKRHFLAWN